ncbi:hypothetical protein SAMN05216227_1009104 [Pseudorhodobacter antarcticus]|uniref:Uncharacterized protein n=1 Tax=Pseudorhodobacter antarcticus TaxID=1077947 RepID=A0A1H8ETV8_9RHOB|nr:hypothetical protein [Pseudorhodobacter antarcticus]SEN22806.1 hypothetical protein SAMN05216227_1009104 [Pseudorhodobacter antarcticus]
MNPPEHWGNLVPAHLNLAKDFLQSAELLEKRRSKQEPLSLHAPQLVLLAHSLELTLKAISLWQGKSQEDVRANGHNLRGPYSRAKGHVKSKLLIAAPKKL